MKNKILPLILLALTLLTGCWSHKKRAHVPHISHVRSHGSRDLQVDVSRHTGSVCLRELGINLTEQGYVMVGIRVVNKGGDVYVFRPSYCDLTRVPFDRLAEFVYYDTPTRCLWLSVPSFLLWWPAIPLIVVPCGLMWSQQNQQIERRITQKIIGPDTCFKIAPYETVEKFFLVPEESWFGSFSIGFFDKTTEELVRFTVAFEEREG